MNYFFKFESMDIEIKRKLLTMEVNTNSLFLELIRKVRDEGLSEKSISKIEEMFNDLKTSFENRESVDPIFFSRFLSWKELPISS